MPFEENTIFVTEKDIICIIFFFFFFLQKKRYLYQKKTLIFLEITLQ